MNYEPPFDGVPCPMCPTAIRNLSACAHNLASRLSSYQGASLCKIMDKQSGLRAAVPMAEPYITDATPEPIRTLFAVSKRVADAIFVFDLFALKGELQAASDAVRPLSDAHFANPLHSNGGTF